jgi:predicted dehydrogenase
MAMNKVRVGCIGTGLICDLVHLPALKLDERVDLVALCGRNRERTQQFADKHGIAATYTDYRDMIARAGLDAIVIASPDDLHYEMAMAALDAGLHVLCEKPLALHAADARAMYDKAEAKGVRHMSFFTYRWLPHYRYLRELLDQNPLGRLYHCEFSFRMNYGAKADYGWRFDRKRANGALGDMGAHMFDLARYLVGDIVRVNGRLATHVKRNGVDGQPLDPANDAANAWVEFANGAIGSVDVSSVDRTLDVWGNEQRVMLQGEAASIVADVGFSSGVRLQIAKGEGQFEAIAIPERYLTGMDASLPFFDQFLAMMMQQSVGNRLFVDGIVNNTPIVPSLYDGLKAQQIIDAVNASHASGGWVETKHVTRLIGQEL